VEVVKTVGELRSLGSRLRENRVKLSLVPTMGALHAGHLSLVREARKISNHVVVSIFVNPTQFGPGEDYQRYPRHLDDDLSLLRESGVASVFVPETAEIYPQGFKTFVIVEELSQKLCGASRPVHFRGVATVVLKLLNIVEPEFSIFGQKDFQQCVLIRRMVKDLDLATRIVVCPIVREDDGLAMSSRNQYLSLQERKAAPVLYRCLQWARQSVEQGETRSERILLGIVDRLGAEPLARLDYAEIVNEETLDRDMVVRKGSVLALAVWIGRTRLIDNAILEHCEAGEKTKQ
jgi:pantoate--beta-alanine ligase